MGLVSMFLSCSRAVLSICHEGQEGKVVSFFEIISNINTHLASENDERNLPFPTCFWKSSSNLTAT